MYQPRIPIACQAPIADRDNFLAPLLTSETRQLIAASGVDTPRVTCYTVERVLRLYLFAAMLPGVMFHSLRGIVSLKEHLVCRLFVGLPSWSLQGLSDANQRIPFLVFHDLYHTLSAQINSAWSCSRLATQFGTFKIFDCTHLRLALKLMPWGTPQNQRSQTGQLKCAVRLDGVAWVPDRLNLDPQSHNDNTHFATLIDWTARGLTYLFDRGFRKIDTLVKIHASGNFFITRLHQGTNVTVVKELLCEPLKHGDLTILHDQSIRLGSGRRQTAPIFRLLTARSTQHDALLYFLTNRTDLAPEEIAAIYRDRWQIECFFKWLKHSLHITHLFSYSENGVYLQLYATLIYHVLLLRYHRQQKLAGQLGIATQRRVFNALCQTILTLGVFLGQTTEDGDSPPCPLVALPPGGEPTCVIACEVNT